MKDVVVRYLGILWAVLLVFSVVAFTWHSELFTTLQIWGGVDSVPLFTNGFNVVSAVQMYHILMYVVFGLTILNVLWIAFLTNRKYVYLDVKRVVDVRK